MASTSLSSDYKNVIKILVFGSSGSGKTSMINLLTGSNNPVGDGNLNGCTFESKDVEFKKDNNLYLLTDTVGLNEAEGGKVMAGEALVKLIELIKKAKDGFNLVIFVRKCGVLSQQDEDNYNLIVKNLLDNKVNTMCVNIGAEKYCEDENSINQWWLDNEKSFKERGMNFNGGVSGCCAKSSINPLISKIYEQYSKITYPLIWEAIDKYKSKTPVVPKIGNIKKSLKF